NEFWGKVHFWISLVCINGIFFPMFMQGLAGVSRRLYDGGIQYAHAKSIAEQTNPFMSICAIGLLAAQVPFLINFFYNAIASLLGRRNEIENQNPWHATTLDWAATTSPPLGHGNFEVMPVVYRGPYEYSVAGAAADYIPQHVESEAPPVPEGGGVLNADAVEQKEILGMDADVAE